MNKIEDAIQTLHAMDKTSSSNSFLSKIHPLPKLLITIIYIVLLTSINKYNLTTTLAMGIYLFIISIIGNLSIKNCLKSLKIIFVLLFIIGIANPILDRTVIAYIGIIPITTGIISMLTLFLKGAFAVIASYFLIATTGIEGICFSLKMLHIPNIIVTVIMLIYRYIIVFLKEIERMWTAYKMRAPKQKGINYKVWGSMIGMLAIRSIDKAQTVYESMELRCFNPDTYFIKEQKIDRTSIIYFLLLLVLLLVIRFIPVFELIGKIFI